MVSDSTITSVLSVIRSVRTVQGPLIQVAHPAHQELIYLVRSVLLLVLPIQFFYKTSVFTAVHQAFF